MKLSARNILEVTVTEVKKGLVNTEVDMKLAGDATLTSVITLASAENLQLAAGSKAYAVIKASNIMIGKSCGKISARNAINCTVTAIKEGKVSAEIDLDANGTKLASIITVESAKALGLAEGKTVNAVIKASDVMMATE